MRERTLPQWKKIGRNFKQIRKLLFDQAKNGRLDKQTVEIICVFDDIRIELQNEMFSQHHMDGCTTHIFYGEILPKVTSANDVMKNLTTY